jgi:predicted HTH transcriptional regulator
VDLGAAELRELVAQGEGKSLEFKRGLPRDEKVARSLCAFANTRGGLLLIGVTDQGGLHGAPRPRETLQRLRAIAAERVDPPLAVEAGIVAVGGVRLVWCSVPLSPQRPHAALDASGERALLVRAGSSNRRASGATLAALQRGPSRKPSLDPLERRVVEWVAERSLAPHPPGGDATVAGFAKTFNIGLQRARRTFTRLEAAGRLVGHGGRKNRVYSVA